VTHPPPPSAAAWARQARERRRAEIAALLEPRPARARAPWYAVEVAEVRHIVDHVPADRGRAPRAVAVWVARVSTAGRRKAPCFTVRLSNVAEVIGASPDYVAGGLSDLEAVGLVCRIGHPTPRGQALQLYSPPQAVGYSPPQAVASG
jgi:hypothetical protein